MIPEMPGRSVESFAEPIVEAPQPVVVAEPAEADRALPPPEPMPLPPTPAMEAQRSLFAEQALGRQSEACFERDPAVIKARLDELADADREDRQGDFGAAEIIRDGMRREEVMKLYASGCLQSSEDYGNAAVILQHGRVPEHHLAAFIFASQAAGDGHVPSILLARSALDRWLMTRGQAQIFATQQVTPAFFKPTEGVEDPAVCLWPVDPAFPAVKGRRLNEENVPECPYPAESNRDVVEPMLALYAAVSGEQVFPEPRLKPRP